MSNKIILKKSSVPGKVPTVSDIDYGELAINYSDGVLYYKKVDNTIQSFSTGGGGGGGFTYGNTEPSGPNVGDRWLNSDTGIEYTYIDDGDSSQWVQTNMSFTQSPRFLNISTRTASTSINLTSSSFVTVYGRSSNTNVVLVV